MKVNVKKKYSTPIVEKVTIDNEVSLVMATAKTAPPPPPAPTNPSNAWD